MYCNTICMSIGTIILCHYNMEMLLNCGSILIRTIYSGNKTLGRLGYLTVKEVY